MAEFAALAAHKTVQTVNGDKFILGTQGEKKQVRFKLNPEPKKGTDSKRAKEEK